MADVTAQLDYARGTPWHRRRWLRGVALVAVVGVALFLSRAWFAAAWHHACLLYWQGKCLSYAPPAEPVVARGDVARPAGCWSAFYKRFSPPGRNAFGTVFLHEMAKRDGSRRLVAVEVSRFMGLGSNPDFEFSLEYLVIDPATPWRAARLAGNGDLRPSFWYEGGGWRDFVMRPGVADPADGSHFTVEVAWRGNAVTMDGWLREDDTVVLEPRESLGKLGISKF